MFSVHCPDHGCDVLLSERRIEAIDPGPDGLEVRWVCWCGTRGATLTGRPHPTMVGRRRPAV